jgi:hypothetical protein
VAIIHPDNGPSRRVAQKLGMVEQRSLIHDGEPVAVYQKPARLTKGARSSALRLLSPAWGWGRGRVGATLMSLSPPLREDQAVLEVGCVGASPNRAVYAARRKAAPPAAVCGEKGVS